MIASNWCALTQHTASRYRQQIGATTVRPTCIDNAKGCAAIMAECHACLCRRAERARTPDPPLKGKPKRHHDFCDAHAGQSYFLNTEQLQFSARYLRIMAISMLNPHPASRSGIPPVPMPIETDSKSNGLLHSKAAQGGVTLWQEWCPRMRCVDGWARPCADRMRWGNTTRRTQARWSNSPQASQNSAAHPHCLHCLSQIVYAQAHASAHPSKRSHAHTHTHTEKHA